MKIFAAERSQQGTGASRRLRNMGKVPGILYGGESAPVAIEIDHNVIFHALKKESFHASIHELELGGATQKILLRDFQTHAFKKLVLHVDFQRVDPKKMLHMKVPFHFLNAEISPAVKTSAAVINHVTNEIEITCLPADLPEFIEIDLAKLEVGTSLHLSEIVLPKGVKAVARENMTIVTAAMPTKSAEADDAAKPTS